jgi:haloacetate dehalogenase
MAAAPADALAEVMSASAPHDDPASLRRLFPGFAEQRIGLGDGTVMRAVTGGSGPVVLLIHGYPETLVAWHRLAPVLARDHTVVAADLPGYGESRLSATSRSLTAPSRRAFAADLLEMMDRLGHRRFAVIGHDRGARAAFHMALAAPDRVAALASLTVIPTLDVWEAIDGRFALRAPHWFFFAQPAEVLERLLGPDPVAFLDHVLTGMAGGLDRLDPLALASYRAAFSRREVREAVYRDYRAALSVDLDDERAARTEGRRLACPVLYLWEAESPPADPLAVWRRWADTVSGAGIHGGHLQPEIGADEVLPQLLTFLAQALASDAVLGPA